ncbi:MAG: type II toxin-antitoxin system VapC family toxin [Candidatus Saccharibacteria bacterium]
MKDILFLDTNVMLDLLGERDPFYDSIAMIVSLADMGEIQIVVSALSYSTVYFILSKFESDRSIKEKLSKFKVIVITSDLTDKVIDQGLVSRFNDFEDALQYHCALNSNCNILITRNGKDFRESDIPVMTPDEYLSRLKIKT